MDRDNCGSCGHVCNIAHGSGTCNAGSCTVTFCQPGYADCNGLASDGASWFWGYQLTCHCFGGLRAAGSVPRPTVPTFNL